jgi:hypothetical protein
MAEIGITDKLQFRSSLLNFSNIVVCVKRFDGIKGEVHLCLYLK